MPNSQETFYVIPDAEGSLQRWTIQRTDVELMPGFTDALCTELVRRTFRVAKCQDPDFGFISVCITSQWVMYSVRVKRLHIQSHFTLRDGRMLWTPLAHAAPVAKLTWVPPADMQLMYGLMVTAEPGAIGLNSAYLVAVYDNRRWVLPVPNVYADGKLCHGQPPARDETALGMLTRMCSHLQNSAWNADLYSAEKQANTNALFRWEPLTDGKFEQLPWDTTPHWAVHCQKAASAVLESITEAP